MLIFSLGLGLRVPSVRILRLAQFSHLALPIVRYYLMYFILSHSSYEKRARVCFDSESSWINIKFCTYTWMRHLFHTRNHSPYRLSGKPAYH